VRTWLIFNLLLCLPGSAAKKLKLQMSLAIKSFGPELIFNSSQIVASQHAQFAKENINSSNGKHMYAK